MSVAAPPKPKSSERRKQIAAAVLGGVVVLFAALNFDEVEVNWILGSWSTPLVVVIAVPFLLGVGCGVLFAGRRAKRPT